MASGVYLIENTINGRKYVGSAINIRSRWQGHRRSLERGRHHSKFMQRCWNKHGADAFSFKVLVECCVENLTSVEQDFIDDLAPEYNSAPFAGSQLGYRHSAESRRKMSENSARIPAFKGHRHSDESKAQISKSRMGKGGGPRTPERRANISAALKGKPCPPDRRLKISATLTGRKQSPETIAKRVEKLRGRVMPDGFGAAIAARMRGKKLPQSTIDKIKRSRAAFSDDQVREIRDLLKSGVKQGVIASIYGVDRSVISTINTRTTYAWVT